MNLKHYLLDLTDNSSVDVWMTDNWVHEPYLVQPVWTQEPDKTKSGWHEAWTPSYYLNVDQIRRARPLL